jgi:hypothetical protein
MRPIKWILAFDLIYFWNLDVTNFSFKLR